MQTNTEDLDKMSGVGNGAKPFVLDLLSLNGDAEIKEVNGQYVTKGGFYRLLKLTTSKKNEKPDEERLGETVKVVFLKIRRALQQRSNDGKLRAWTSEHTSPDDFVELKSSESQKVMIGTARALREQFESLRTVQYVYGLLLRDGQEPELVKMRFKGAALGSQVKGKDVKTFYDYIYDERKDEAGNKRHLRHVITELGCAKEEGKKTYFTVTFRDVGDLTPELQVIADEKLRDVHAKIIAIDAVRDQRIAGLREKGAEGKPVDTAKDIQMDAPEGAQESEDFPADDIPF